MELLVVAITQIDYTFDYLHGSPVAAKNEFLALEDTSNIDDGKLRYDMFVKAYNEARERGGINVLTPSEMFLQRLITSTTHTKNKQQSVTYLSKYNI